MTGTEGRKRIARSTSQAECPSMAGLHGLWNRLHQGDREPWPDDRLIAHWGHKNPDVRAQVRDHGGEAAVSQQLQEAWGLFHAGEFGKAIRAGAALGVLGAAVANKAAAIQTLYRADGQAERLLGAAIQRGEAAVRQLDAHANTHYTLSLVLGRYSQRISILKALAQGFAGRVRGHLRRALELEPRHAEAHVALGLYHAELVNKLGSLAASLTYGVTAAGAIDHFRQAQKLAPDSPIIHIEQANGLMLLDRSRYAQQAAELYAKVAAFVPLDAMERLDIQRAKRGISG